MMRLPDAWTWDFWIADTGREFHVFFLRASRALHDPDRRHRRASVGHAVSDDLRTWTLLPDALVAADEPAWDDLATWTGSVIADPRGGWRMFYTGLSRSDHGQVQRIGYATSPDLIIWTPPEEPVLSTDPQWYEQVGPEWVNEAWRDPWAMADPDGNGFHLLITARGRTGDPFERGVIGHAWSADLDHWQVRPPLSEPGAGFGQLEVPQVAVVDGQPVLVFSCLAGDMAEARRPGTTGGVWAVPCESVLGPFDIGRARLLLDDRFYAGRLVQDRAGDWQVLGFCNRRADGGFDGGLSDPMPVRWVTPDTLAIH